MRDREGIAQLGGRPGPRAPDLRAVLGGQVGVVDSDGAPQGVDEGEV
jgi:hypothetical protein